jgi:hypothetical protein
VKVRIEGEGVFDVPDDATPGEIEALAAPKQPSAAERVGLTKLARSVDEKAPTLRTLAPGLWALVKGTPENVAERATHAQAQEGTASGDLRAVADAFDRTPMAGLTFAPTGSPIARQTLVKPPRLAVTPAAKALQAQGVKNLTVGQMAPKTTLGIIERVSADHPFGMGPQREAAEQSFMRAAQDKGIAPGAAAPVTPDLQIRLKEALDAYGPAYDKVRSQPIDPAAVSSLPDAAKMPGRGVDARTAAGVKAEVENALTVIGIKPPAAPHAHGHGGAAPASPKGLVDQYGVPIPPAPKPPPKATAGDLMKVRENVREQIRAARQAQDFDRLRLLEDAEDVVTGAIESNLTPELRKHLQDTDRQYARLMTATSAAPAGQTAFTPGQYLRQVERSAGRRTFKQGGAGDLQDLGETAKEVFTNAPMTGFRPGVLASMPWAKYWGAPIARLANTQAGRKFLLQPRTRTFTPRPPETFTGVPGQAAGSLQGLEDLIRELQKRRSPVGLPAAAGEEDR